MRMKLVATMALVGLMAIIAPARGSPAEAPATMESSRHAGILWADAGVFDADAGRIAIRIRAPRPRGKGRELWQRCTFGTSDPGTYRCGIDVSRGSLAKRRANRTSHMWLALVIVDGTRVAATRFRP